MHSSDNSNQLTARWCLRLYGSASGKFQSTGDTQSGQKLLEQFAFHDSASTRAKPKKRNVGEDTESSSLFEMWPISNIYRSGNFYRNVANVTLWILNGKRFAAFARGWSALFYWSRNAETGNPDCMASRLSDTFLFAFISNGEPDILIYLFFLF